MLTVVVLALLAVQAPQTDGYREVVALQKRAAQPSRTRPDITADHRRSIEIAQKLRRPRLVAVLFQRLGRHLEAIDVQQAVIAYETGIRALAGEPAVNLETVLARLTETPKGYVE